MPDALPQQIKRFVCDHTLLQPGQHILVAVSGGADSVALLYVLWELKHRFRLRLTVAHLNHKIRGQAAEEDAGFVKQLASRLQLDFVGGVAAVPRLAKRHGISLEMAGRKARYDFLEKTALARGCDLVATAHTADDNAETVLLMLVRGCGLQGLAGIAPSAKIGKITVVRPLLGTGRPTIEKYLRGRKISWREDFSNADHAFLRNRVRHELLPLLEKKYNQRIKETLNRMSVLLKEENDFIERIAENAYAEAGSNILDSRFHGNDGMGICACHSRLDATLRSKPSLRSTSRESSIRPWRFSLNGQELAKYHIAVRRRALRRWLLINGVDSEKVDFQLINRIDNLIMRPGKSGAINLAGGLMVKKNYPCLTIECQRQKIVGNYRIKIKIPGTTVLPGTGLRVKAEIGPGVRRERSAFGKYPAKASLSLRKWRRRLLWARNWQAGDRMRPYGLDGSKKIQDIFSDAKVPVAFRRRLPIFECGREIIWIPGYRIAEGWQVPDPADKALQLTVEVISKLHKRTDAIKRVPPQPSHNKMVAKRRSARRRVRKFTFETGSPGR